MIRWRSLAPLLLLLAGAITPAGATPVTLKELDLMVRMGVSEKEIIESLESRHLMAPIDAATEKSLTANGAKPALLSKIKAGKYVISAEDAAKSEREAAEQRLLIAKQSVPDKPQPPPAPVAEDLSDKLRRTFDGKLVHVAFGQTMAYSIDELKNVRYYVIYEANGAPPCHSFTQKLVDYYNKTKPDHPEFEIIYVSIDRSPEAMEKTLVTEKMPWPAVRFDALASMHLVAAKAIPWMAIFNSDGAALFPMNPKDKSKLQLEVDPGESLVVLDAIIHGRPPPGSAPAAEKQP